MIATELRTTAADDRAMEILLERVAMVGRVAFLGQRIIRQDRFTFRRFLNLEKLVLGYPGSLIFIAGDFNQLDDSKSSYTTLLSLRPITQTRRSAAILDRVYAFENNFIKRTRDGCCGEVRLWFYSFPLYIFLFLRALFSLCIMLFSYVIQYQFVYWCFFCRMRSCIPSLGYS